MSETPVRAFVSYSWSSPTHEAWVINLASRLREDGVDVILDKWDLKPGYDAYQFMESMVTDPTVTKVLMICDRGYVDKANARSGGVGAESQVISAELYGRGSQDKFSALITDEDGDGSAYVPIFYKGRIFFDFRPSRPEEAAYEQLLRWLVDKPLHVKPSLGRVPSDILQQRSVASGTLSKARRAEEFVKTGASQSVGLIREFGDVLVSELRTLRPVWQEGEPHDDAIMHSIEAMRPHLSRFNELVSTILKFGDDARQWGAVITILEQVGALMWRSPDGDAAYGSGFDPYKVVAHDAFLSVTALALDEQRFDLVRALVDHAYLVNEDNGSGRRSTSDFTVFRQYVPSLKTRNDRLQLNRFDLEADIIKEGHSGSAVPSFESIMQADFFLYLRFHAIASPSNNWYPTTLVYAARRFSPFPIFARAESASFLKKMLEALGSPGVTEFKAFLTETSAAQRGRAMFDYSGIPINYLANVQNLAVLP